MLKPFQSMVLCAVILTCAPHNAIAQSRPAQCLLEVKGVHYLGGPCIFTSLDKLGSFRITDVRGLNLIAQVDASKKDEGKAVWNGPLGGNSPTKELGDAYRSGGCWMASDSEPGKYEDSRICAWSPKDRIYLGPSPRTPDPSLIVYYGSRVGMYHEIASRQGLDTPNAQIVTKPSKDGAVTFCREYSRDYSVKCVDDQLRDQIVSTLHGNCRDKTFADANGNKYAFLGKTPKGNDEIMAEFSIRDLAAGEILDGSSASGYDVKLGIYQALCPSSAAAPLASNQALGIERKNTMQESPMMRDSIVSRPAPVGLTGGDKICYEAIISGINLSIPTGRKYDYYFFDAESTKDVSYLGKVGNQFVCQGIALTGNIYYYHVTKTVSGELSVVVPDQSGHYTFTE